MPNFSFIFLLNEEKMKQIVVLVFVCILFGCWDASEGAIATANNRYAKGQYEKAIAKTLEALRDYDYSKDAEAELNYIMAQSYEKLGERDKSTALYKHIVEKYPNTKIALLAKTEIK